MRTGLVRLEFHSGQLGRVVEDENKSRHHRCRPSGFDGGLSSFQGRRGRRRSRSRSRLRRRHFAHFSLSRAVADLWTEILPNDMLVRPRSSRIFYGGKFFSYPLRPFEALLKLGVFKSVLCVLSWLKARLLPVRNPRNFEEWVSNQFGKRLFNTFFKSYTEKVWGMSCKEISADWAAQR